MSPDDDATSFLGCAEFWDGALYVFQAKRFVRTSRAQAWDALQRLPIWWPSIETITEIEVLTPGPFAVAGTRFMARTPENVSMLTDVTVADAAKATLVMSARSVLGFLEVRFVSELTAQIRAQDDGVILTWQQAYPGLAMGLITVLPWLRNRESSEVVATLERWATESK